MMKSPLKSIVPLAACFLVAFSITAQAQEPTKPDATGNWTWSQEGRNGGEVRKFSLALKVEGEKLTGKLTSPGRGGGEPTVTEITEGKVKDGEISFKITREFGGNSFAQTYSGKVSADTITGKIEFERNGETRSRDWEAKREAAKAAE